MLLCLGEAATSDLPTMSFNRYLSVLVRVSITVKRHHDYAALTKVNI